MTMTAEHDGNNIIQSGKNDSNSSSSNKDDWWFHTRRTHIRFDDSRRSYWLRPKACLLYSRCCCCISIFSYIFYAALCSRRLQWYQVALEWSRGARTWMGECTICWGEQMEWVTVWPRRHRRLGIPTTIERSSMRWSVSIIHKCERKMACAVSISLSSPSHFYFAVQFWPFTIQVHTQAFGSSSARRDRHRGCWQTIQYKNVNNISLHSCDGFIIAAQFIHFLINRIMTLIFFFCYASFPSFPITFPWPLSNSRGKCQIDRKRSPVVGSVYKRAMPQTRRIDIVIAEQKTRLNHRWVGALHAHVPLQLVTLKLIFGKSTNFTKSDSLWIEREHSRFSVSPCPCSSLPEPESTKAYRISHSCHRINN